MRKFDYIIIGSGLAGLYAAYKASFKGSVAVLTKTLLRESNSFNAQGGIAAVTSFEDDPKIHKSDTLIAGRGLCEDEAVDILVNEGPDRIAEIIADGIHVPQDLLHLLLKIKGVERLALVTDSMRAAGMPEGPSILGPLSDGQEVIVEDGVAKLMDKSAFAGSVATADRLVRTMVQIAGCSITDAVRMITENPARIMGISQYMLNPSLLKIGCFETDTVTYTSPFGPPFLPASP